MGLATGQDGAISLGQPHMVLKLLVYWVPRLNVISAVPSRYWKHMSLPPTPPSRLSVSGCRAPCVKTVFTSVRCQREESSESLLSNRQSIHLSRDLKIRGNSVKCQTMPKSDDGFRSWPFESLWTRLSWGRVLSRALTVSRTVYPTGLPLPAAGLLPT